MMFDLIRSFGLVTFLLLSLSLSLGLASASGGVSDAAIDRRLVQQFVHRSAAILGLVGLVTHVGLTVADTYIATPLHAVLVPFTSNYQWFALGLGSLALYSFVIAAASGWLRLATASLISERGWRWVHRSAYMGWVLCLGHGLLAGPDTHQPWAVGCYLAGSGAIVVGFAARVAGERHVLQRDFDGALRVAR